MDSLAADAQELARRLLRLIPGVVELDWAANPAAIWQADFWGGRFVAHPDLDDIVLDDLLNIDDQKAELELNTRQFLSDAPANNVLLWGARGTGKSSLIHALVNAFHDDGLRLIEVNKSRLANISEIAHCLRDEPFKYILFCDDLSFEAEDASYKELKSALEGSMFKSSANMLIYATSNRRHLIPEYMADNEQASFVQGELHQSEAVEEKISLSDRFGLWLSFYPFKQDAYIDVVKHWLNKLASAHGVKVTWNDEIRGAALRWALARGVRSGRTAQHFALHWVGKQMVAE